MASGVQLPFPKFKSTKLLDEEYIKNSQRYHLPYGEWVADREKETAIGIAEAPVFYRYCFRSLQSFSSMEISSVHIFLDLS